MVNVVIVVENYAWFVCNVELAMLENKLIKPLLYLQDCRWNHTYILVSMLNH